MVRAHDGRNPALEVQRSGQVLVPEGFRTLEGPEEVQREARDRKPDAVRAERIGLELAEGTDALERGPVELLVSGSAGRDHPDTVLTRLPLPPDLVPRALERPSPHDSGRDGPRPECPRRRQPGGLDGAVVEPRARGELAAVQACFEPIQTGARGAVSILAPLEERGERFGVDADDLQTVFDRRAGRCCRLKKETHAHEGSEEQDAQPTSATRCDAHSVGSLQRMIAPALLAPQASGLETKGRRTLIRPAPPGRSVLWPAREGPRRRTSHEQCSRERSPRPS